MFGCLALAAYFGHHLITGKHGLGTRSKLVERSDVLGLEIASLEAVRAALERDVSLLRPDNPDPDFVEEIARDVLGFVRPGDRVLVLSRPKQLASTQARQPAARRE